MRINWYIGYDPRLIIRQETRLQVQMALQKALRPLMHGTNPPTTGTKFQRLLLSQLKIMADLRRGVMASNLGHLPPRGSSLGWGTTKSAWPKSTRCSDRQSGISSSTFRRQDCGRIVSNVPWVHKNHVVAQLKSQYTDEVFDAMTIDWVLSMQPIGDKSIGDD